MMKKGQNGPRTLKFGIQKKIVCQTFPSRVVLEFNMNLLAICISLLHSIDL